MKLRKDKWLFVKIENVASIIGGGTPRRSNPEYFKGQNLWIGPTEIPKDRIRVINDTNEKISDEAIQKSNAKLLPKDTILFTTRATVGEVAIAGKEIATSQSLENFVCKPDKVYYWYLAYWLKNSQNLIHSLSAGTTFKGITRKTLAKIEIPLPPLEEQKQIAALFQSIETAIELVEGQEKNLKALWKKLIDGLVGEKPLFGKLLVGKKFQSVKYCAVTDKIMRKIDPVSYGVERIVAGENLASEDFKIRTWGTVGKDCLGPAFHVLFKPGDILYGSRRTYLRKVALAHFEGVCANTTYVIRAKEEILLQDYLKHIMLSERFTQYSIGVSKGSTNPYINWKDLDDFSFQIPDIDTQREIVIMVDRILNIIEQLRQQKTTLQNLKQKLLSEILG